jgi:anion-transporting  ArsA/GET3 family ATPase
VTARLHVLLGAGGVGKTTLAAGYALALARDGRRVGLLGIDPSRRLQDALGVTLSDEGVRVPGAGDLRAAVVEPHRAIERWVAQACVAPGAAALLATNPFFVALGDQLATATDVLAAVRIAEWAELDPALTDLVVDTAPGVAAVDFLRAPRQIEGLVRGRLVGWLRAAARGDGGGALRLRAGRVLGSLARIAGVSMLTDLARFFALSRRPLERMLTRVEQAARWLRQADTELLLVTSPADAGAGGARQLAEVLRREGLSPSAVIVNRTWPRELEAELQVAPVPAGAEAMVAHARALCAAQRQVIAAAVALSRRVLCLPSSGGINLDRRAALAELGAVLRGRLEAATIASQPDPWERPS